MEYRNYGPNDKDERRYCDSGRDAYRSTVSRLEREGYDVDEFGHFYPNNDHTRVCGYWVDQNGNVNADM